MNNMHEHYDLYIGTKPASIYTTAFITEMNEGTKLITLRARGRAISNAVSVLELLRNRLIPDRIEVDEVQFYTDIMEVENQIPVNVSAIAITTKIR